MSNSEGLDNIQTGFYVNCKKGIKNLLNHSVNSDEVKAAMSLIKNFKELEYIRNSPLGEGKDINNPVDAANIEQKRKKGVKHYNMLEPANYDNRKKLTKPPSKKYLSSKEIGLRTQTISKGGCRWQDFDGRFVRNRRDVWDVQTRPFKEAHFATFPPDLIRPCIEAGCPENGIVLDMFMGAGTTAVVASELGRDFVGIELNPEYVKIAGKRLLSN